MTVTCSDQAASASRKQQQSDLPQLRPVAIGWLRRLPPYDMIIQAPTG